MRLDSSLTSYIKINSKWVIDLQVRRKLVNLHDVGCDNGFLDIELKSQVIKEK